MLVLLRGLVAGVTFLGTFFFTFWICAALLTVAGAPQELALIASVAISVPASQIAARFVWRKAASAGFLGAVAVGAVVTGTVGFVLGFFGPLIFAPKSNQGPLLGFITGPLGFLLGAVGGAVYWLWRQPRPVEPFPT